MINRPGWHCSNRLFEWTMAGAMLGMGVELLIWPDAIAKSKMLFMLDVLGSHTFMLAYLVVGGARCAALYLNGKQPTWGTRVRAVTAICGAFAWAQMGISLYLAQVAVGGPPSPSLPLYFALVIAEFYSTFRAASDARYR